MTIIFELPVLPAIVSNGSHGHWAKAAKDKARLRRLVEMTVARYKPHQPFVKVKATFIRISAIQPDGDNLIISFKPIRDGLVSGGIVVDDKPENMPDPVYRWEKGKRGQGKIRVEVEVIP